MNRKRILSGFLAAILVLVFCIPNAWADNTGNGEAVPLQPGKFNIVGVFDGSGSLINPNGWMSDVYGYRYDAFAMFMDLMPMNGNEVGAIVFNCNSTNDTSEEAMLSGLTISQIRPINSQEDKNALKDEVENVPVTTKGKTDIGTALLQAAKMLEGMTAKNGKKSIILLFTDGYTEAEHDAVEKQSKANRDAAIELIKAEDIDLCGVFLNNNNVVPDDSEFGQEVLNIVRNANGFSPSANPDTQMGGLYIKITSAEDLLKAYQSFYAMLVQTEQQEFVKEKSFVIPRIGVSDVNISILANPQGGASGEKRLKQNKYILDNTTVTIIGPNGEIGEQEKAKWLTRRDSFLCYKIPNPEYGPWKVVVNTPDDGMDVQCSLIVNVDIAAQMETEPQPTSMALLNPIQVRASLFDNEKKVTDTELYEGYSCELVLSKTDDSGNVKETQFPMEMDEKGNFMVDITPKEEGAYTAYVRFTCGDAVSISSRADIWTLKNKNPSAEERNEITLYKGLFSNGKRELDLSELVTDDAPLDYMTYKVTRGDYPREAYDDTQLPILKLDGIEGIDGTLTVTFTDYFGAKASTDLVITLRNRLLLDILLIVVALLVIVAVALGIWLTKKRRQVLNGMLHITFTVPVDDHGSANVEVEFSGRECQGKNLGSIFTANRNSIIDAASYDIRINDDAAAIMGKYLHKYEDVFSKIKIQAGSFEENKKNRDQSYYTCRVSGPKAVMPESKLFQDLRDGRSISLHLDKDYSFDVEYIFSNREEEFEDYYTDDQVAEEDDVLFDAVFDD